MAQTDTDLYKGHRDRMRAKLRSFGVRFFETYELVEMLLYFAIPRKNTHPTAKLLLKEFTSLEALFSATKEDLVKLSGVGNECADFIISVGSFMNYDEPLDKKLQKRIFSNSDEIGAFFQDYFKGKTENETALLLLDANLSFISVSKIYPLDLSSGAVRAKPFVDEALKNNAAVCVVAHNHPHSSPFPTDSDREGDKMLKSAFSDIGILFLEDYVVTDEGYSSFSNDKPRLTRRQARDSSHEENNHAFFDAIHTLLKHSIKNADAVIRDIKQHFSSRLELFQSNLTSLTEATKSERVSELLIIIAELISRKKIEGFKFGKPHTSEEIEDFLVGFYINSAEETAAVLPVDHDGKVLALELLSHGTVNALSVTPRAILEKLVKHGAESFILSHNHPRGAAQPSDDDVDSTARLFSALKACGVNLLAHYVVANNKCNKIAFGEK